MDYLNRTSSPGQFLPYGRQAIGQDDLDAVIRVLQSDYLTTGPVTVQFEEELACQAHAQHAVVCSSGTAALHLAAMALDLGPEDSVIVPSLTFLATANAARFVGAEVVFADVDPTTGLLTPETLLDAIDACSGKAKALFPVHLNGQSVEMEEVTQIARAHGLRIIEDACHALGTRYVSDTFGESRVGSCTYSDITVFSFHPVKTIAMGEGGALTTNCPELARRLRQLRNHGLRKDPQHFINRELGFSSTGEPNPWYYEMQELAFNYRASDIHCALGLSQLRKLDSFVEKRQDLARYYSQRLLGATPLIKPVPTVSWNNPAWHIYVVHIDFVTADVSRSELMQSLRGNGIGTQVHYLPVHLQPYYSSRYGEHTLPGSESYYQTCISLPLYPSMTNHDVEWVTDNLLSLLQGRH